MNSGEVREMLVNVATQLKEDIGSVRNYEINEEIDVFSNGHASVVEGGVKLTRTDRSILATGSLRTTVEITCSRCLRPFDYPIAFGIEEEYFPSIDVVTGAKLPPPEEDTSLIIDERHLLDLTEVMRQNALLSIPMKPLCEESCAGLCPECGNNLNQGPCGCSTQRIDPRWSKLIELQ